MGAKDAEAVVVAIANRDLRGRDQGGAAVFQLADHVEVVVEHAAFDKGVEVRRDPLNVQPGHPSRGDEGVGANVAAAIGNTRALGIGAPRRLLLAGLFEGRGQPALMIPRIHLADLADFAALDHFFGQHHHGMARIGMGQHKGDRLALDDARQVLGFGDRQGHWLFAEHWDAGLQKGFGRLVVGEVGGDDGDVIEGLLAALHRL